MNRQEALSAAGEVNERIKQTMNGSYTEVGPRQRLLSAFTVVACTHHASVTMLARDELDSSALALLRPLVESCFRGLWIYHETTDKQVEEFASGKRTDFPDLPGLVEVLAPLFPDGLIEPVKKNYKTMCGFTHTGYEQIFHMFDPEGNVTPSYPESIVVDLLANASSTLAIHMQAYCHLFELPDEATAIRDRFNALFGKSQKDQPTSADERT
jgi:hypothetical protein